MAAIRKGTAVRQVVPVIEGVVADVRYDADADQKQFLVVWTDVDGSTASRWFTEAEITEVKA